MFAEDLPESVIKQYSIRVKELGGINLGQGIPSFPTAKHILSSVRESLADPAIGVYPNFLGQIELREALCHRHNEEYHLHLLPEKHILITVGAMEGTATAILSLVSSGDRVGVLTPDYCNHFPQILLSKAIPVEIPFRERGEWEIDLEAIEKEAKKGLSLLILTNPNNPTGAVYDRSAVSRLITLSNRYGFYLVADETYSFLWYERRMGSLLDCWKEGDRLVVVRSFSKEYAMTGWRVGYVIAQPNLISMFSKTHDALVGTASKISQRAALAAVTGDQAGVGAQIAAYRERRDLTTKYLRSIPEFRFAEPQGAYYVFPRYAERFGSSSALCERILQQAKVAVVPGRVFGDSAEGHLRISFCVETELLREGLERLVDFFGKGL